jgi:hypothetical protein
MTRIETETRLEQVEHVLGSGTGVLDFAVAGESSYYTWEGEEVNDWKIDDVGSLENADEDRFIVYPAGEYFTCLIEPEAQRTGKVRCWSE